MTRATALTNGSRLQLHGPTMGTRWALTCDHAPGLDTQRLQADLQTAVEQLDAQMSPWNSASDLVRLNRAPLDTWVDLPADMLQVLARALGSQADGRPWPVALESPQIGRRAVHGVIELQDLAVATSGDYRRFVQVGDVRLAHSMDGRRAAPVRNDVGSVTVLARNCMDADAWATALLVAGSCEGLAMAQRMGLEALFLLRRAGALVEVGLGRFACAATA